MVREIKEIPAKKPPSPTSAAAATSTMATADAPAIPDLTTSNTTKKKNTKNEKVNEIYGVGINLAFVQAPTSSSSNPRVGVHSLEPTGSASKAGLQPGDIILSADSVTFHYENKYYLPDDVAAAIRGPEGSHVKVLVERNGKKLEFDLIREPIGVMTMTTKTATTYAITGSVPSDPPAAPCAIKVDGSEKKSKEDESPYKEMTAESSTTSTNPDKKKKNAFDSLFHSLSLSEDEQHNNNEKELASSLEDADQFDDDIVVATTVTSSATGKRSSSSSLNMDASSASVAASFEEKTIDDDDDNNNDNKSSTIEDDHSTSTNQQWEMLSERSGSTAILISFSGSVSNASYSFPNRCSSPSVLKNKFVLTESNGEAYIYHVVLPTDTLQGLCLAYKISATRLRMENNFSGNSLQLAPKKLRIPNNVVKSKTLASSSPSKGEGGVGGSNNNNNKGMMIRVQDTTSKEYKLYAFVAEIPTMELVEAKAYLDLSNWDLEEALRSAREDEGWSLRNNDGDGSSSYSVAQGGGEICEDAPSMITASVKPKALTAHDIYSGMPPYDGDGFELRDIKQR